MILIVEDFVDTAEVLCRLLKSHGYPCDWVQGGREALAYIRSHAAEMPLLVLLDEMMPMMTGVEVLREIRSDPAIARTTVIMHSAGFDLAKRDEAMALGAAAWLLKGGSDFDATLKTIEQWYERVGGVKQQKTV